MPVVSDSARQPELRLRGFTYLERNALMPELGVSIDLAGGWILDRRTLDANSLELVMESQAASLPDVYGALLSSGLELTRDSHRALAQRCLCCQYLPVRRGPAGVVVMYVEILFLEQSPQALDMVQVLPLKSAVA
ncbi:hypothetical protein [Terriglobus roseus]|uniref:Uncharacterized protein n=1 Tax=Terriglobus roseus TaxID=392734 RepID=A0A1G7FGP3_9BACT|nr:hypothetical protein [Terriglobus roseus]SDE75096.1 hypothetical protein SAMN05444167_0332 [Terriglobus roseus]